MRGNRDEVAPGYSCKLSMPYLKFRPGTMGPSEGGALFPQDRWIPESGSVLRTLLNLRLAKGSVKKMLSYPVYIICRLLVPLLMLEYTQREWGVGGNFFASRFGWSSAIIVGPEKLS